MAGANDVTNHASPSSAALRKARKSRGRGLRTTSGCAICRKRHMKCDEVQPICGPCGKGNRNCTYGKLPAAKSSASNGRNSLLNSDAQPNPSRLPQAPHLSFSSTSDPKSLQHPATSPKAEDTIEISSPQSTFSTSTGYGTEVAPLRWFGLLAHDAAEISLDFLSPARLNENDSGQVYPVNPEDTGPDPSKAKVLLPEGLPFQNPSKLLQLSATCPTLQTQITNNADERRLWLAAEPFQLKDHEHDMFERFVNGISLWIDLFDPLRHFSTFVPHLALYNQGLMKAILALGARHLSIKPLNTGEASVDRTASVAYYYETLHYLQTAMRYTSYKNSLELLATVLIVSTFEMLDGAGKGWERHLKGVFWIQRSREINGESGGLEQAIWWAWLRQDVWAAFRERRRCFSFFEPTRPYDALNIWDLASRVVYILKLCVNYSSDEERQASVVNRVMRATALSEMLDEWHNRISVHFHPLPVDGNSDRPFTFTPLWINPPAFGTSLQMYSMARILLLINQPAAGGHSELAVRDNVIAGCIDTIGGIALKLDDDPSRLMSTQCLYAAGLYCADDSRRVCIAELIQQHSTHTGWPTNTDLAAELRLKWLKQNPT